MKFIFFLIEGTKTIKFKPGPLGMSVRWGEGVVTNMDQGSQAEKLGVKVGWKLLKVGNDEYTERFLDKYIAEKKPFSITFNTDPNPVTFVYIDEIHKHNFQKINILEEKSTKVKFFLTTKNIFFRFFFS